MLSEEYLKQVLNYDPETGLFRWKINLGTARKGAIAGSLKKTGYVSISINKKEYMSHRLAWLYMNGASPKHEIDHINGIRNDNRIYNLREATRAQNLQNQRKCNSKNKSSGLIGVSFHKPSGTWFSRIQVDGKVNFIGAFQNANDAHIAYINTKRKVHSYGMI